MSVDDGVAADESKQWDSVLVEVQAEDDPHLQVLLVQILSTVPEPHASEEPQ